MIDTVNILEGSTFVTSDRCGDIEGTPTTPHGFFALDTRFLSRWQLTLDGQTPAVLSTDTQRYYVAQFFLAPSTGTTYVDSPLSLVRRRWVDGGMREEVAIVNHTPEPKQVHLHLAFDADFADLFEVKDALSKKGRIERLVDADTVAIRYTREDFQRETRISVQAEGAVISDQAIDVQIELAGHGSWQGIFSVQPVAEGFLDASRPTPTWEAMEGHFLT